MNATLARIADRIDRGITDHTDADALRAALAQPAQARQPLTDAKIDFLLDRERMAWASSPPTYEFAAAFARAIEAAHGIGDAA